MGVNRDYSAAFVWETKAAEQNNTAAQNSLGTMYSSGQGVARDEVAAIRWFTKAAHAGDWAAESNLGDRYFEGKGITKNLAMAYMWFEISERNGSKIAADKKARIVPLISAKQVALATGNAQRCIQSNYQNCE
jgi:TPR repeat protein